MDLKFFSGLAAGQRTFLFCWEQENIPLRLVYPFCRMMIEGCCGKEGDVPDDMSGAATKKNSPSQDQAVGSRSRRRPCHGRCLDAAASVAGKTSIRYAQSVRARRS
jgi:hypothetical protein